jgi:hypothetical protein
LKRAQFKHICFAGNNPGFSPIKALPLIPRSGLLPRVSKDAPDGAASWFETREDALLTIRYGEETRGEMQKE